MSVALELLDPRHDPEPSYWAELRERTGRPAGWSYELLRLAAWHRRTLLLIGVLRDGPDVRGAVATALVGTSWRPGAFAPPRGLLRQGILDVLLPLSGALPGWWLAARSPAELLAVYRRGVRAEFGRGILWREVGDEDSGALPGRFRLARPLNPVARLATPWPDRDGWLDSLAPSRSADLRRQLRRVAADPALTMAFGPAEKLVTGAEVARLKRENELKYGAPPPLPTAYLTALVELPEAIAITFRDRGSRLLAVGLILDHPRWPLFLMWGAVPPERGGRRHLYFTWIAEAVGWSIAGGRTGLILGKGKTSLKRDLGAAFLPGRAVAVPH